MHRIILIVVLFHTQCKPLSILAQQSVNLKEVFVNRERDHQLFSDSSTCEIEKKDDCFFLVTKYGREFMISGRALLHVHPRPTNFIIDLEQHTIIIPPNQTADLFIHSRNWGLISVELLNGSAIWNFNNEQVPMKAGTKLSVRDSTYQPDKDDSGFKECKAWIKGLYLYDDISLKDFAAEITRKFSIPIRFDDHKLKDLRMCTAIDSEESLAKLLDRLSTILHLQYYTTENKEIRLKAVNN
jgi:ferric-dicitrate binding protein FerR (iron transport regulator)